MELREQFPTMMDVRQIEHVGFSRQQIAGLLRVKALYQRGAYHDACAREDGGGYTHQAQASL